MVSKQDDEMEDDGMKSQVLALPESIRSRFGEICWAQGGGGYGWWPSLIYDPCRAGEPARTQARRFLGSRFLVYFIECPESPFSILDTSQLRDWTVGLSEDLHLGKSAKYGGKSKHLMFQKAFLSATLLYDKPLEFRLEYSNSDEDEKPEMNTRTTRSQKSKLVAEGSSRSAFQPIRPGASVPPSPSSKRRSSQNPQHEGSRRRISNEETFHYDEENAEDNEGSDESQDSQLVCKIIMKASQGRKEKVIGIVILPSIANATFADIRVRITEDLCGDLIQSSLVFKFFLMEAGVPVSRRQETGLGPVYQLLYKGNGSLGQGTLKDPVLIYISDKYNAI